MNYYINEYSLRGQFSDVDEFLQSLRNNTLPLLKKIEARQDSVIWKKDSLWQRDICNNITLSTIDKVRTNERNAETTAIKKQLIKIWSKEPYWNNEKLIEGEITYCFDLDYQVNFDVGNCFVKAIEGEGQIISFLHDEYKKDELELLLIQGDKEITFILSNLYSLSCLQEPIVKSWKIDAYHYEIRFNEFTYHAPHFHVSTHNCQAVYMLPSCKIHIYSGDYSSKFKKDVDLWVEEHKKELVEAWNEFHSDTTYCSLAI